MGRQRGRAGWRFVKEECGVPSAMTTGPRKTLTSCVGNWHYCHLVATMLVDLSLDLSFVDVKNSHCVCSCMFVCFVCLCMFVCCCLLLLNM